MSLESATTSRSRKLSFSFIPWFLLVISLIYSFRQELSDRRLLLQNDLLEEQKVSELGCPEIPVKEEAEEEQQCQCPDPVCPEQSAAQPESVHDQWRNTVQGAAGPFFGDWRSFESLFTFGDSYTATLFDVAGEQPRPDHPLGNHGDPTKPLLMNWPVFMTSNHNASFLKTYNFGVGGSTVDRDIVTPYMVGSTFKDEVQTFINNYASWGRRAEWKATTSLFVALFGVNDLILPRFAGTGAPSIPDIFESYTQSFVKLYNAGARNFIVMTVPPAYRSVHMEHSDLLGVVEDMASFNSRVFEMKSVLQNKFPLARFATFDAHSFWARVIETPADFEETKNVGNSTAICETIEIKKKRPLNSICQDGQSLRSHIWTSLHGTSSIHNATSARIVQDCLGPKGKIGFCS